jgi:hypothetical protein
MYCNLPAYETVSVVSAYRRLEEPTCIFCLKMFFFILKVYILHNVTSYDILPKRTQLE